MEEYKLAVWERDKMFLHQEGGFFRSLNCNFPEESFILSSTLIIAPTVWTDEVNL
jgi:hypothetical protein